MDIHLSEVIYIEFPQVMSMLVDFATQHPISEGASHLMKIFHSSEMGDVYSDFHGNKDWFSKFYRYVSSVSSGFSTNGATSY